MNRGSVNRGCRRRQRRPPASSSTCVVLVLLVVIRVWFVKLVITIQVRARRAAHGHRCWLLRGGQRVRQPQHLAQCIAGALLQLLDGVRCELQRAAQPGAGGAQCSQRARVQKLCHLLDHLRWERRERRHCVVLVVWFPGRCRGALLHSSFLLPPSFFSGLGPFGTIGTIETAFSFCNM